MGLSRTDPSEMGPSGTDPSEMSQSRTDPPQMGVSWPDPPQFEKSMTILSLLQSSFRAIYITHTTNAHFAPTAAAAATTSERAVSGVVGTALAARQ